MRIGFDSEIFSFQIYGGVSRYITQLASELARRQQDVRVFAPLHVNKYLENLDHANRKGIRLPLKIRGTLPLIRRINGHISKSEMASWGPDIVHETYYTTRSSAPKNTPLVVTLHDMIHEKFPYHFNANDRTSHIKRIALDRADHVICVSENSREDLLKITSIDRMKTSVVHLGFGRLLEPISDKELLISTHRDRPYILYVGQRNGHKNFGFLLQAFARSTLLRKELDIVAFGGHRFSREENDLINRLGLVKHQIRHCVGDDSKLTDLYRQAAAFVYPSLYEGFGIPPLEAMANDCPVVSSCTSSMPEVIGNAAEFFDPTDHDELIGALELTVFSDSRRAELIHAGRKRLMNYSWEKCAAETLAVYKKF